MRGKATTRREKSARCTVCRSEYIPRYNLGKRARVCPRKNCKLQYSRRGISLDSNLDRRKFFSEGEFLRFVLASYGTPNPAGVALRLIAATGMRVGEAILLQVKNVHPEKAIPFVEVPTLKRVGHPIRNVHLHDRGMIEELKNWISGKPKETLLFPCTRRLIQLYFSRISKKLEFEKEGAVHVLRHTRASQLIEAGFSWKYIQEQLGWVNLNMASNYIGSDRNQIAECAENLPSVGLDPKPKSEEPHGILPSRGK